MTSDSILLFGELVTALALLGNTSTQRQYLILSAFRYGEYCARVGTVKPVFFIGVVEVVGVGSDVLGWWWSQ